MKSLEWLIILTVVLFASLVVSQEVQFDEQSFQTDSEKVVVIIIDGARYSETLGDTTQTYTPKMWNLSSEGTVIDNFYNDSITYTSRAIPALWSGTWTDVRDTTYLGNQTQYSLKPSIFEYYRKDKNMPAEECFYVLKYIQSLWLPSFDPDYGPAYWPTNVSVGQSDKDVSDQAQLVMDNYHPHFLWIYLADVDHGGHSGNWDEYTTAIGVADSIVEVIWKKIETDTFYKNSTTLFVTNDHGRHDDQNGGFKSHGDGCDGCRHIQYLALGPNIKKNFWSTKNRRTPDMSTTIAGIFDIEAPKMSGEYMSELFVTTEINDQDNSIDNFSLDQNYPNPFNPTTNIRFSLPSNGFVTLKVYNTIGEEVIELVRRNIDAGNHNVVLDASNLPTGAYFYRISAGDYSETKKMLLIK